MIPPEDEMLAAALRRALHDSADSFEPRGDGLEKIRHELMAPAHQRAERRLRSAGVRLGWLLRVWAEPLACWARSAAARARGADADRGWSGTFEAAWTWAVRFWSAAVAAGLARLPGEARPVRRTPAHAMAPTPSSRRAARLLWLRWGAAVSGAAVVAGLGLYGLAQLRQTVITQFTGDSSAAVSPPASHSPRPRSKTPAPSPSSAVFTPQPSARPTHHRAKPKPTCLPTPSVPPSAPPSPSLSPSPAATSSPGATATPSPGVTTGAARTDSAQASASRCSPAP